MSSIEQFSSGRKSLFWMYFSQGWTVFRNVLIWIFVHRKVIATVEEKLMTSPRISLDFSSTRASLIFSTSQTIYCNFPLWWNWIWVHTGVTKIFKRKGEDKLMSRVEYVLLSRYEYGTAGEKMNGLFADDCAVFWWFSPTFPNLLQHGLDYWLDGDDWNYNPHNLERDGLGRWEEYLPESIVNFALIYLKHYFSS